MFTFNWGYFIVAVLLFIVEVLIAVFVNDSFIRPYFGDFLVVILIYTFLKSFFDISVNFAAIFVLIFAYLIEVLQYFKFVKLLGLQKSYFANTVLGNSFAWSDMLAYTAGIVLILWIEKLRIKKKKGSLSAY